MPPEFNREHAAILQSQFSLGLIEAVTEISVSEEDLLKSTDDGQRVLSLENVSQLLSSWTDQKRVESVKLANERDRVDKILISVQKVLSYLSEGVAFKYEGVERDNIGAMFCMLGCIAESLTIARGCLYLDVDEPPTRGFSWDFVIAIYKDSILADACASGWCPFLVNYISAQGNLNSFRYTTRLGPASTNQIHRECSVSSCKLKKIDSATYQTQHHVQGCTCSFIQPNVEDVIQNLESGTNPVICLPDSRTNPSRLDVKRASEQSYIAISHVWADGLGSNTETGLPKCQAWKVAAFASSLVDTGCFWIDSLCVPDHYDARKKALKLMGAAYKDAEVVVVLDKTIQSVSTAAPPEEMLCRILTSPWMQRLWTLQEAVLAKRLLFQFADGIFPLVSLEPLLRDPQRLLKNAALSGLAQEIHRLLKFQRTKTLSLADVARSLKWRSTSRASDEFPAIVSLLPVDRDMVLEAPEGQKMAELLLSLQRAPINMPFLEGPKVRRHGFSWAPESFMAIAKGAAKGLGGGLQLTTRQPTAQVTESGLIVDYMCYEITPCSFLVSDTWALIDSTDRSIFHVSGTSSDFDLSLEYQCNFLLFSETIPRSRIEICIAVSTNEVPEDDALDSVICCVYERRLLINGQRPDISPNSTIMSKTGASMRRFKIC